MKTYLFLAFTAVSVSGCQFEGCWSTQVVNGETCLRWNSESYGPCFKDPNEIQRYVQGMNINVCGSAKPTARQP